MEKLTHILVFKTTIKTEEDKTLVKEFLSNNKLIEDWNVDCEDIDCVLRIVSYKLRAEDIIKLIHKMGFECEELV